MTHPIIKLCVLPLALGMAANAYAADPVPAGVVASSKASYKLPYDPAVPLAVPPGNPGLRKADGTPHPIHTPNVAPNMINVVERAAELGLKIDLADTDADDQPAIEAVINDAKTTAGSTVYFPNGTYNLIGLAKGNNRVNLQIIKSGINLVGESREGTILKSHLDSTKSLNYTVLNLRSMNNMVLKNFTFTSTWNKKYSTETRGNSKESGGPANMVATDATSGKPVYNITIDNILVEKFKRMGVRVGGGSHDIVIKNSVARNATDVGDGGTGYGFSIQGGTHQNGDSNPFINEPYNDTYYVVLDGNRTEGPYIRHGILLQYWTHNNLIINNVLDGSRLDAIDLHGEDEYANEIAFNTVSNTQRAAIALGNSGAGHDKTGVDNWIHSNDLISNKCGISVEYGTQRTTIERNTIRDNKDNPSIEKDGMVTYQACGAFFGSSFDTVMRDNLFVNNTTPGFTGIVLLDNKAEGDEPAGGPVRLTVSGNKLINSGKALEDKSTLGKDNTIQKTW